MDIKIYFVTYREAEVLDETLRSLFDTCDVDKFKEINIINNHSEFQLDPHFAKRINVLHNNLRPDFSTGHLSRNWNQALINGFKDLETPDCDILMHSQNDVKYYDGWLEKVIDLHQQYDFFAIGAGDCLCSYTPDAVRKVGIWDERYCGIGFQEADYFVRAAYHNPLKTCITDVGHNRLLNNLVPCMTDPRGFDAYEKAAICHMSNWEEGQNEHHKKAAHYGHSPSMQVFRKKFRPEIEPSELERSIYCAVSDMTIYSGDLPTSMLYPYFESKIPDRHLKNYMN